MSLTFKQLILDEEKQSRNIVEVTTGKVLASTNKINSKILGKIIEKSQQEITQVVKTTAMRTDMDFLKYVNDLWSTAVKVAAQSFNTALLAGFETDLKGRAEIQSNAEGSMKIEADITKEDTDPLINYPILGHTGLEIATSLANSLKFAIIRISTAPLRGDFDISQVPRNLEIEQELFARKVAQTTGTAYLSGTQAAQELIRGAIANAIKN